ncbi:MAG: response regulator [Myxococcaceae bacterium]
MELSDPQKLLTSHEVGQLLQIAPSSVLRWVNEGLLPAYRTPGGHRRIKSGDLLQFLRAQKMYIPESLRPGLPKILLVDDDRQLLNALQRSMKVYRDRVRFSVAESGIAALVLVGELKPDLLVLDVHMPEMDGLEVCRQMKANPALASMEVVMMTGRRSPELEQKARSLGARALLSKPVTATHLMDIIMPNHSASPRAGGRLST